jgi:hypothetical protein
MTRTDVLGYSQPDLSIRGMVDFVALILLGKLVPRAVMAK